MIEKFLNNLGGIQLHVNQRIVEQYQKVSEFTKKLKKGTEMDIQNIYKPLQ